MKKITRVCFILILSASIQLLHAQVTDTLSNWDGIAANWESWSSTIQVVNNPVQDSINPSTYCIKLTTTAEPYDLMLLNLGYVVSFEEYPKYSLLCYPPAGGGDVVLKFENSDASDWQELRLTAIGGQWNRLNFDFIGLPFNNFTRMVIFYDFLGTTAGKEWYLDDITRQSSSPLQLESNLPLVVINTFGANIPDDPKITAHLGIINNSAGNRNHLGDPFNDYNGYIGIEIRGQSSQMFPKKCYGMETRDSLGENLDVSLLGLPEENDWILYAPYTDKSLMRDVISYEIGSRMGEYCTRNIYCELVINNDYKGIYVLQEKIKKDKNRVDIASLNPDEITGDNLTGGYIISVDKIPVDFQYGTDGWLSAPSPSYPNAMDITFQYYYPDQGKIVTQQRTYIKNFVADGEKALIASTFKDPATGYLRYFDAPSFVDFMLLSEISKEVDKYRYSTYFHKQKDSDGGKLFAGPAWDFNLGYGNVNYWDPGIDYTGWLYEMVYPSEYSIIYWWKRMMEDPYFRDLTKTRWTMLREDKLSNIHLNAIIDSISSFTEEARIRNYERWPILGTYVWPNYNWQGNTYEDEVAYFRNFLLDRVSWMDYHINGKVLQPMASIKAENNIIYCRIQGDYFRNPVLKKGYFSLHDSPPGISIDSVLYTGPNECELILSGNIASDQETFITVDKKIINTWVDLTSNKLATADIAEFAGRNLRIFTQDGFIHIFNVEPGFNPETLTIYSVNGQKIKSYSFGSSNEYSIPEPGIPGIYQMIFNGKNWQKSIKIVVP
ncbi:MAG: CotH kinase family protein [Bacteroidetes bacterium]|nr:CotH kinase family protein [Bacteroidota bacterium]